jgi:hypothetical protein
MTERLSFASRRGFPKPAEKTSASKGMEGLKIKGKETVAPATFKKQLYCCLKGSSCQEK